MKKNLVLIFLLLFVTITFGQDKENATTPAANFVLEDLDGDLFELSEAIGEAPVLINFWATWCKPCIEEMVQYNKIYNDYKDKGVKLIAISTDAEKTVSKVRPFVKSKGYEFVVLYDTNNDVAREYYAEIMPHTFILDKEGNIVYSHMGYKKGDEKKVIEILNKLLD